MLNSNETRITHIHPQRRPQRDCRSSIRSLHRHTRRQDFQSNGEVKRNELVSQIFNYNDDVGVSHKWRYPYFFGVCNAMQCRAGIKLRGVIYVFLSKRLIL